MNEWFLFALIFFGIFIISSLSIWFQKKLNINSEFGRKLVHITIGLVVTICPFLFKSNIQLILLSSIFIGFNLIIFNLNIFKTIHHTNRNSYGTIYFPLSVLILSSFFWDKPISLILSILVMTLADPIAAIIGGKGKNTYTPWIDKKSRRGFMAMFSTTLIIIMLGTDLLARIYGATFFIPIVVLLGASVFTAFSSTLAESISFKGSDNLSVPIVTFLSYEIYLINYTHGTLFSLLLWVFISLIIFSFAWYKRSLSSSGAISGYLIGIVIFGAGGWAWIMPLVFFFISSSVLSHLKHKKFAARNILQILANGIIGALFAIIYLFWQFPPSIVLYLGAIASATADTWATEIGFYSRSKPRLIFSKTTVNYGESGGVTLLGIVASVLGAFFIGLLSESIFRMNDLLLPITIAGLLGSLTDSILGRFIQAQFKCKKCDKKTEDRYHCNDNTILIYGSRWIGNDMVNFITTIVGAIAAYQIWMNYG